MKMTGIFGRLALTNLILLVLISFFIIYVFHKTVQIHSILHDLTSVNLPVIADSDKMSYAVQRMEEFRLKYQITQDADFFERFNGFKQDADILNSRIAETVAGETKIKIYGDINALYKRFTDLSLEQINKRDVADSNIEKISEELSERLSTLRNTADDEWQRKLEQSNIMVKRVLYRSVLFMAGCIICTAAVAFFNTRSIAIPLLKLGEKTNEVASGRFPENFSLKSPDEIEKLASDFNIMISRLKESREQKEEFVSNVSHELKTPLSSIKEAANMLKEGVFENDPESSQRLLEIINIEAERLITSVNGIIEISRLDINDTPYELSMCSINTLINDIIKKTIPIAVSKKITIVKNIQDNLPDVSVDQEMLSIAIENLMGNALKYTPDFGEIIISAYKTDEHTLTVSVKDNGRGISDADLPHVFERYRKGRNQQGNVKGTGLGLSISKKIITRHGGEIWAKSKPGEGSEFLFTLPVYS